MAKKKEETKENLPALRPPRLPYHPVIEKEFGIDVHSWKALVEAIFPNAKTSEAVRLALSYCKARKLDPFKRCVHIVPIYDSEKRCWVDTIWPGIGELRTTAHRTGVYAGRDKTEFGPLQEETWGNTKITFPEWAQVTVYRMVKNVKVAYAGPQVYWIETYGSTKDGTPNSMWKKRPRGQLDKCAEAAALRSAFPEEIGNDYIETEAHITKHVESRTYDETAADIKETVEEKQGVKKISVKEPEPEEKPEKKKSSKAKKEPETEEKPAMKNYLYTCAKGHEFDEPETGYAGEEEIPICPECLTRDIKKNE